MYVIVIRTPSNFNNNKIVNTYYVGMKKYAGVLAIDWDEDIKFARRFVNKIDAKKLQSILRTKQGSEKCKIKLAQQFSKN